MEHPILQRRQGNATTERAASHLRYVTFDSFSFLNVTECYILIHSKSNVGINLSLQEQLLARLGLEPGNDIH